MERHRSPASTRSSGPGNAYVAAAKAQVASDCAIDFFAGPSEIAVVSSTGNPAWIAADLIAQAEHDPDARAILFTPVMSLALAVAKEIDRQLPATGPAAAALRDNGGIIVADTLDGAIALSQRLAPEHVVCDNDAVARRLTRAGTVFVGSLSAQACGDYVTGSNHVLPDQRRRRRARRPQRRRLRPRVVGPADRPQGPDEDRPCRGRARGSRRSVRPRRIGPHPARRCFRGFGRQEGQRRRQPSG